MYHTSIFLQRSTVQMGTKGAAPGIRTADRKKGEWDKPYVVHFKQQTVVNSVSAGGCRLAVQNKPVG